MPGENRAPEEVGVPVKNGTEEIPLTPQRDETSRKVVIQKSEWKGKVSLDVRVYIETGKYTGPTKRGIKVPFEQGEELAQKILKVARGE